MNTNARTTERPLPRSLQLLRDQAAAVTIPNTGIEGAFTRAEEPAVLVMAAPVAVAPAAPVHFAPAPASVEEATVSEAPAQEAQSVEVLDRAEVRLEAEVASFTRVETPSQDLAVEPRITPVVVAKPQKSGEKTLRVSVPMSEEEGRFLHGWTLSKGGKAASDQSRNMVLAVDAWFTALDAMSESERTEHLLGLRLRPVRGVRVERAKRNYALRADQIQRLNAVRDDYDLRLPVSVQLRAAVDAIMKGKKGR
jgi:hypothetical protein